MHKILKKSRFLFIKIKQAIFKLKAIKEIKEIDRKRNLKKQPIDKDEITLECFWSCDFYTPSTAKNLLKDIKKLNLNSGESSLRSDPIEWIFKQRSSHSPQGWINICTIDKNKNTNIGFNSISHTLPNGVDYATVFGYHLTPSLTCIAVCFYVEKEYARAYQKIVAEKTETKVIFKLSNIQLINPTTQKIIKIENERKKTRKATQKWFKENFTGIYATNKYITTPYIELISLKTVKPFPIQHERSGKSIDWLHVLGIDDSLFAYESEDKPTVTLGWSERHYSYNVKNERQAILAYCREEVKNHKEFDSMPSFSMSIEHDLREIIVGIFLLKLLGDFNNELSLSRDRVYQNIKYKKHLKTQIFEEHTKRLATSIDTKLIVDDVLSYLNEGYLLTLKERFVSKYIGQSRSYFKDDLLRDAKFASQRIQQLDHSLKEIYSSISEAKSLQTNIRLQKSMRCLTILTLVTTMAATFIAYLTYINN